MSSPPQSSDAEPTPARWFADEVQPHESTLRAWLRGHFPTLNDIDDLVQEAYVRLIRAKARGQVGNTKNYLFTTARNAALDHFRHASVLRFESVEEIDTQSLLQADAGIAETISRKQELEILREAMHALPKRCRQVFTLRKLYGLSHAEIAARLEISEKTVEVQIDKAMRRCAIFLRSRGLP